MSASLASTEALPPSLDLRRAPPLCVDLDGTLILSDLLLESLLELIKRNPLYLFLLVVWLVRGRAVLKAEVAARAAPNAQTLPYDREFLSWLESERRMGRTLWLCTASNEQHAVRVADYLGLFDGIFASDCEMNLVGAAKAARLVERFGERGFDYCGNGRSDIAVWKHAHGAIVVHGGANVRRDAARHAPLLRAFPRRTNSQWAILRSLRLQQWAKNVLVLVPIFAAHRVTEPTAIGEALLAMLAFCLCASSVYVTNDLLDLDADRAHCRKSKRPFAAGEVSLQAGLGLAPGLLVAALLVAALLPKTFGLVLVMYYVLTLGYSFALKKVVFIDVIVLAVLYSLRIVAGAAAIDVPPSFWLLLFSLFLFLSLALVKRFVELEGLRREQRLQAAGRGYDVEDLPSLQSLGSAAGYLSVLVLALYIDSPNADHLYRRPEVVWILCVLLLCWISRMWMKAQRGEMHDDPVIFALRDRMSQTMCLLGGIVVAFAI